MSRYQQADPTAVRLLIEQLSPQFFRFFASQMGSRTDAEDMLQELWLRIHHARHTQAGGARAPLGVRGRALCAYGELPVAAAHRIARIGHGRLA